MKIIHSTVKGTNKHTHTHTHTHQIHTFHIFITKLYALCVAYGGKFLRETFSHLNFVCAFSQKWKKVTNVFGKMREGGKIHTRIQSNGTSSYHFFSSLLPTMLNKETGDDDEVKEDKGGSKCE